MADTLVIRLAREELVYLLRALSIPAIATLEPGPLMTLEGEQLALALAVADRTLRARGMVRWGGPEQRAPDPVVVGLLRALGQPSYTLMLDVRRTAEAAQPGGQQGQGGQPIAQRLVYSFASYTVIEQTQPEPGVHQFVALATAQDAFLRLLELIEVTDTDGDRDGDDATAAATRQAGEPPTAQGEISVNELSEMNRLLAAGDAAGAEKALSGCLGLPLAQGVIGALTSPVSFTQFGLWPGLPFAINSSPGQTTDTGGMGQLVPRPPQATLIVAQALNGEIYTLAQGMAGAAANATGEVSGVRITVAQVSPDQARAAMANILNPALAIVKTGPQENASDGNSGRADRA